MSIPPQEPSAEAKPKEGGGGGPLGGIQQWLVDSYNGLYVIVLKPSMPESMLYGIGIIGVLFGLLWAYAIQPVEFAGANPNRLNAASQEQWLRLVAVSVSDQHLYGPEQAAELVRFIPNPRATINALLTSGTLSDDDAGALQALYDMLPDDIDATSAAVVSDSGPIWGFITGFLLPLIIMVIIIIAGVLLWRLLIYENLVAPVFSKVREIRDPAYAAEVRRGKEAIQAAQEQRREREAMRLDTTGGASDLGAPVMQNLAIFATGRAFDESYEIELESGEFLGQSGSTISESTDPDPYAIDVWLFDIFDSMTVAKTFISPQANADPNLRNRVLAGADDPSDVVVATPDAVITVDSPKLRLQAKFNSLEINEQGRFTAFKMVLRAWQKEAGGLRTAPPMPVMPATPAPMPASAPPMSSYDNIQFDPPPAPPPTAGRPMSDYDDISFDPPPAPPPAGAKPMSDYDNISFDPPPAMPQRPAVQPLQPPPLRPQAPQPLQPPPLRRPEDDDPFGGTGDFTPLNG